MLGQTPELYVHRLRELTFFPVAFVGAVEGHVSHHHKPRGASTVDAGVEVIDEPVVLDRAVEVTCVGTESDDVHRPDFLRIVACVSGSRPPVWRRPAGAPRHRILS